MTRATRLPLASVTGPITPHSLQSLSPVSLTTRETAADLALVGTLVVGGFIAPATWLIALALIVGGLSIRKTRAMARSVSHAGALVALQAAGPVVAGALALAAGLSVTALTDCATGYVTTAAVFGLLSFENLRR